MPSLGGSRLFDVLSEYWAHKPLHFCSFLSKDSISSVSLTLKINFDFTVISFSVFHCYTAWNSAAGTEKVIYVKLLEIYKVGILIICCWDLQSWKFDYLVFEKKKEKAA